jgi:sugar O-acyltransferase (sialic acid O-acetyltransferase NeuD family)
MLGDVNGISVLSWEGFLAARPCSSILVAIGNGSDRRLVVDRCKKEGLSFPSVVGYGVRVSQFIEMRDGAVIFGGALLTVNISIGSHVHINQACSISHDVRIGDFSTLSPGVNISGHVEIGEGVFIGTGASIINGSRAAPLIIANGSVIGAGACVTHSIEVAGVYVGVPARLVKAGN